MSQLQEIEFTLSGSVAGKPISARKGLPFAQFLDYNTEVLKYVQGSDSRTAIHDVQVQVEEGSYLLRVIIPAGILASLIADTAKLGESKNLGDIDPKRADVVKHWIERARMDPSITYVVRSPNRRFRAVTVDEKADFRSETKIQMVEVERYMIGTITDWGGASLVNIHLRPRNATNEIIIAATEAQIRNQQENLVFHKAIVRFRAKQNTKTGKLEDYKLMDLRPYNPNIDDSKLQALFEKGAKAWADVPDAGAWVEELRGGASA